MTFPKLGEQSERVTFPKLGEQNVSRPQKYVSTFTLLLQDSTLLHLFLARHFYFSDYNLGVKRATFCWNSFIATWMYNLEWVSTKPYYHKDYL